MGPGRIVKERGIEFLQELPGIRVIMVKESVPLFFTECLIPIQRGAHDFNFDIFMLTEGDKNYISGHSFLELVAVIKPKSGNYDPYKAYSSSGMGTHKLDVWKCGNIKARNLHFKYIEKFGRSAHFTSRDNCISFVPLNDFTNIAGILLQLGLNITPQNIASDIHNFFDKLCKDYSLVSVKVIKMFIAQTSKTPKDEVVTNPATKITLRDNSTQTELQKPSPATNESTDPSVVLMSLAEHVSPKMLVHLQRCVFDAEKVSKLESGVKCLTTTVNDTNTKLAVALEAVEYHKNSGMELRGRISEIQKDNSATMNTILDKHTGIIAELNKEIVLLRDELNYLTIKL